MSTYAPKTGSIAERICAFFRENPDEELTRRDIADKFGCASSGVDGILFGAISHGVIATRNNEELVRVWCAGTAKAEAPPADKAKRTYSPRVPLPLIDLSKVAVRAHVPMPVAQRGKGETRYDELFDKLEEVGASVLLPKLYAPAVSKALQTYAKRTSRQFKVRTVDAQQCGIWRTA